VSDLPGSWVQAPLGHVATTQLGRMLSASRETGAHPKPYLRNRDVQWGHINVDDLPVMDFAPNDAARFLLNPGDVLVCEGGEVGRAAIWNGQLTECYFQKALHRVRTSSALLPKFLLYLLEYYSRINAFERHTSGSTIAHLPQEDLRNLPVPIPPSAEQDRIVAAIEEQFSRLDAGIAAMQRVRKNLSTLRGLLPLQLLATAEAAAVNAGTGRDPMDDGSHRWVQLAEVSQQVVDCEHRTPTYLPEGLPCIDTTCISAGVIHRDRVRYVDLATHESRVRRLAPQHGDLIFAREGTVGTAVVVPNDMHPCLGQRVMLFRPDPEVVDSDYMCLVVNSEIVKRQYRPMLLGTTVPHLNVRDARALRIPLPALPVQRAIAAEADRIGSVLSVIETAVESNAALSSSLRSSILTSAFSGKLVSQYRDDEAASAILERIVAGRASFSGHEHVPSSRPGTSQKKARI
jgi:type I restriction enzyme, S subunit